MSWMGSMKVWFIEMYIIFTYREKQVTVELLWKKLEADINFQGSNITLRQMLRKTGFKWEKPNQYHLVITL
jgi:hypothetical protein